MRNFFALQTCADDKTPKKVVSDPRNCPWMPKHPTRGHPKRVFQAAQSAKKTANSDNKRSKTEKCAQDAPKTEN